MRLWLVVGGLLLSASSAWAASNSLNWTDNSTNEATFSIERKAEACSGTALPFAEIATVPLNVTTFKDTAVVEGGTYCYRVAAVNTAGKSPFSNVAGATIPFTIPAAPSGLGVTTGP